MKYARGSGHLLTGGPHVRQICARPPARPLSHSRALMLSAIASLATSGARLPALSSWPPMERERQRHRRDSGRPLKRRFGAAIFCCCRNRNRAHLPQARGVSRTSGLPEIRFRRRRKSPPPRDGVSSAMRTQLCDFYLHDQPDSALWVSTRGCFGALYGPAIPAARIKPSYGRRRRLQRCLPFPVSL